MAFASNVTSPAAPRPGLDNCELKGPAAPPGRPRRFGPGTLIPALIAAIAAMTVGGGLLPLRWFGFADFQIARQRPGRHAPFAPDLRIHSERYRGGDAMAGNLSSDENTRPRTFTTDSLGFRWTPAAHPGQAPRAVVFRGASFVWGGGLSDDETLPAQLARHWGVNVYNGARFIDDVERPEDYDRLMSSLGVSGELAVYVHLEQDASELSWYEDTTVDRVTAPVAPLKRLALNWVRLSPIIQLATRARKALQNDAILPNHYRKNVGVFPTPGGQRMLFQNAELQRAGAVLPDEVIRRRVDFIAFWNDHIRRRGGRMVVLVIPDKLSVYGAHLGVAPQRPPFVHRFAAELERRGIAVVDGLTVLEPLAASDLASGELAYWRDDLHWTPLGVRRLTQAITQQHKFPH